VPVLGAVCPFLEPFWDELLSKVDKPGKTDFEIPPRRTLRKSRTCFHVATERTRARERARGGRGEGEGGRGGESERGSERGTERERGREKERERERERERARESGRVSVCV